MLADEIPDSISFPAPESTPRINVVPRPRERKPGQ
jgi:hypothetical protein